MLMQVPTCVPSRAPTRLPCSPPRAWGRAALWVLAQRSSRSPAAKAPHRTLSPEGPTRNQRSSGRTTNEVFACPK
jgi:hypothetical protein